MSHIIAWRFNRYLASTIVLASLGIDVAKATINVTLLQDRPSLAAHFANTQHGFLELLAWLQQQGVQQLHVCMDATASYADALAHFLVTHDVIVSVLNPAVLVDDRKSCTIRSKTDALDASLLARYGQERHPDAWFPFPDDINQLRSLFASRDDFFHMWVQENHRLKAGRIDQQVQITVREHLLLLKRWQQDLEQQIKQLLEASPHLMTPYEHLQTIPGIGWYAAARLIAHLGDIHRFPKVGAVVSLAGLSVRFQESGRTIHHRPHIDHHGR